MRYLLILAALLLAPALMAQGETALGKSGLSAETSDGRFQLSLTTATQFRLTYHDTRGEGSSGDNGRDFANFRLAGVRTFLTGHIFDPAFQYRAWLVFSWPSGGVRIEDLFFRWAPEPYFNVTVGQLRVPASWEYLVDHERTGLSDRAIADEAFQQGWGKGVSISGRLGLYNAPYDEGLLLWEVGLFNGVIASPDGAQGRGEIGPDGVRVTDQRKTTHFEGGFRNSDWRMNPESFGQLVDGQLMVAARLEFHPVGEVLRHMVDLDSIDDTAAWFFMVGVGVNWMSARVSGVGTFLGNMYFNTTTGRTFPPPASGRERVDAQIFHGTVDGHFRWIGLSVNWALHMRTVNFTPRGSLQEFNLSQDRYLAKSLHDFGATVDAGYFVLPGEFLISARFSYVDFDEFRSRTFAGDEVDGDSMGADSYEYGGGVAWFFHGDNLKLQFDYRYVAQQLPHGNSSSGATSRTVRTSDWRVFHEYRLQLQWIF
jgi:hypothetical protein